MIAYGANSYVPWIYLWITILKERNQEIQEKHEIAKNTQLELYAVFIKKNLPNLL